MSIWYFVEGSERRGPIDEAALAQQLQSGALPADTLVWRDGMSDWLPASQISELSAGTAGYAEPAAVAAAPVGGFDPYAQEHIGVQYVTYAGFWKRFVAYFIDTVILFFASGCLQFGMGMVLGLVLTTGGGDVNNPDVQLGFQAIGTLIGIAAAWAYFALFESSQYQATPGKMVLQIKVTDLEGNRISLARATGRHFAKILSGIIFLIGYIMAAFTEKKQALHDILAGCLVINK